MPVRTSELLERLLARGIEVDGNKPLNNLSAILSYSKKYKSHGRSGWMLPDANEAEKLEAADNPDRGGADVYGFEALHPGEAREGGGT